MHPVAPGSDKLKQYGYGDEIVLPADAGTDPKWNNLGLVQIGGSVPGAVTPEKIEEPEEPENEQDEDQKKIQALLDELEDSSGNAEFQAVREKVIAADLFEDDTVPTKKAELIQALTELLDGE